MKKLCLSLVTLSALVVAAPAMAQDDRAGSVQVKLLGTAVLPDGKITDVELNTIGVPAGSQTVVNDNVTPTAAIEYFFTNNVSVETIAGVTQHDVDGRGPLAGAELVSDAKLIPATFTAKYHVDTGGGFKPYVGAGAAYFIFFDDDAGAGVVPLGITDADLTNEFGLVLQAGVDIGLGDSGIGLALDAKRYFISTDARFFNGATEVLRTEHKLDPWVLSAGVSFMF